MPSTMTTDIIIKQYRITGRCCVRSGGQFGLPNGASVTDLNSAIQKATMHEENAILQQASVDAIMEAYGYELALFDRDDYGNTLLTYAAAEGMRKAA